MKFRKKPVIIDAVQFDGTIQSVASMNIPELSQDLGSRTIQIPTLEGVMTAQPGDWIIRGVSGEHYPCKPAIFDATYEAIALAQHEKCETCKTWEKDEVRYHPAIDARAVKAHQEEMIQCGHRGSCFVFPTHEKTIGKHFCGQWKARPHDEGARLREKYGMAQPPAGASRQQRDGSSQGVE